ncbi:MAG: hypothetical protein V7K32_02635 [Nostoc sp.]
MTLLGTTFVLPNKAIFLTQAYWLQNINHIIHGGNTGEKPKRATLNL